MSIAISRFVPVVVVERRNGSFGREAPTHDTKTELALRHRSDAFRVVYALQIGALQIGADVWVIHAFERKSKSGIATPRQEIDLVRDRLKRLREMLR
jgi:phage-related protein